SQLLLQVIGSEKKLKRKKARPYNQTALKIYFLSRRLNAAVRMHKSAYGLPYKKARQDTRDSIFSS
ncbi:MAG: hypothetical protein ABFS09_10545, partial [Thermodesulfobacteriota bacterium]